MNSSSPNVDQRHTIKTQTSDTNSISGNIIHNSCNNSQLSSPDISETKDVRKYLSAINLHDECDEKQKTILLKLPGVIKTDQPIVSSYIFFFSFSINVSLYFVC